MKTYKMTGLVPHGRPGFIFLLCLLAWLFGGCAGKLDRATDLYYSGQAVEALEVLAGESDDSRTSELLFLMEQGLIEHELGRYEESTQSLLKASRLVESFEIISVSEQVSSLATTEWLTKYKGEYAERLWVHSYLMMNFLLQQKFDSAQVEARQALKLFEKYPDVLKEDYFTRALMGLCFSLVGEDNDAYLVYRKLAEDLSNPQPVALDLVRLASRLGQPDDVERYRPYIPEKIPQRGGELVLFVASGRIPEKKPGNVVLPPSIRFSFPYYRTSYAPEIQVQVLPGPMSLPPVSSSLSSLAVTSLSARKARIIAKETARVVGKEAIAQSVGNQFGDAAELLTRLSLFLLEEPDVRSWRTLPGRLTLVRVPLPVGEHQLTVHLAGGSGWARSAIDLPVFSLQKGQKVFYSVRY